MARFQAGQSGNPSGRKPGTGCVQKLRALIEADLPDIIKSMAENAKAGDSTAANLLISRVLPPARPEQRSVNLPLSSDPATSAATIIQAVANGSISPDVANTLLDSVAKLQAVIQIPELENRLKLIEEKLSGSN